ncbi:MAG: stage 0 sporulation family protein [Clostridia bacterium]|nr:stage 0 sporulation family protein [Clostridia bacterium]
MATITAVTFKPGGKIYYFAPGKEEYSVGAGVIVETSRGIEYATVVTPRAEIEDDKLILPLKPVVRKATPKDEETHRKNTERREGAMKTVREKIVKHNLDMKLIDCEFAFDGSKAVFYYSAPQRVDFRELVKELSSHFHMRIELRQVGIRDEIKLIGGISPCGRECCCSSCMPDIKKVSIKMAKNQGLSLNPQKISGLCGRLMCCLSYENDYYADACKKMPKIGAEVGTPEGKGVVVNVNMIKMLVRVRIEDKAKDLVTYKDYTVDELKFRHSKGKEEPVEEETDEVDAIIAVEEQPAPVPVKAIPAEGGAKNGQENANKKHGKNNNRHRRRNKKPQNGKPAPKQNA